MPCPSLLLIVTGLIAGLFLIPLNAALQAESHKDKLGKTIATQNGLENLAMLGGAVIAFLDIKIGFNPSELFLALAAFVAVVVIWLKIPAFERMIPFRFDPDCDENNSAFPSAAVVPVSRGQHGGASTRRGRSCCCPITFRGSIGCLSPSASIRNWRFVTSKEAAQASWVHRFIMINRFTFPVETDSPYAVKRMAEFLQGGGKLVLFPEGRLSRTGSLMKLFDGTGFLLFKTNAKVITCYLRGAQRLPFSPNPNRKYVFPRVTAHFSDVLTPPKLEGMSTMRARQKLTRWLYDTMVRQQFDIELAAAPETVLAAIVETARQFPSATVLQDVTRKKLTLPPLAGGRGGPGASNGAAMLPAGDDERIGVLLPNSIAVPVTLLSLWAVSKVPADFQFLHRRADHAGLRPTGRSQTISSPPGRFWSGPN